MYQIKYVFCGQVMEMMKYYSYRYFPPGEKRIKRDRPTSESQKLVNRRKAERDLRWKLNTNFHDGDFLVRLDFGKEPDTGNEEMQEMITKATRKIRDIRKRARGEPFKFVYVKEIGPRGSRHIHMVCSKVDTEILTAAWDHGGIHIDPLNSGGQYRKIAEYFLKYSDRTEETLGEQIGKRWYSSKNLEQPRIIKRIVGAGEFRRAEVDNEITAGYFADKDSIREGVNADGYKYYECQYIRDERQSVRAHVHPKPTPEKRIRHIHPRI